MIGMLPKWPKTAKLNKICSKIIGNLVKSFENLQILSSCRVIFSTSFSSWVEIKYTRSIYATWSLRIWNIKKNTHTFKKVIWCFRSRVSAFFRTAHVHHPTIEAINVRPGGLEKNGHLYSMSKFFDAWAAWIFSQLEFAEQVPAQKVSSHSQFQI